jgi:hypothetical protein
MVGVAYSLQPDASNIAVARRKQIWKKSAKLMMYFMRLFFTFRQLAKRV